MTAPRADLDELGRLLAEATPGPWGVSRFFWKVGSTRGMPDDWWVSVEGGGDVVATMPEEASMSAPNVLDSPTSHTQQEAEVVCDHPGIDHSHWSYCGVCPACGVCKFIGHGPLCIDCYATRARTNQGAVVTPLVDWDSPMWGQAGHNVHEAAWCADGRHDDETDEETR